MTDGLACTGCGNDGFRQLNGKYTRNGKTIIREGEALCDECASQREGFELLTNNQKATTENE